jgi:hypothetical protein
MKCKTVIGLDTHVQMPNAHQHETVTGRHRSAADA